MSASTYLGLVPKDDPMFSGGPQIISSHESNEATKSSATKTDGSTQESSESEDEGESDNMCPYCSSEEDCEHLLLSVDLTFREAGGGDLYKAFKSKWSAILEEFGEKTDFDEREEFDSLLYLVSDLSDAERYSEIEGGPGQSSAYQNYYCSSAKAVINAVAKWSAINN